MNRQVIFLMAAALGWQAAAQSFEVASVKSNPSGGRGREQIQTTPISLTMRNISLAVCIQWAYEVRRDQVAGPDWMKTERYDILAKSVAPASEKDSRVMMRSLLAERFHLTFHRETKPMDVYEMTVGKGGAKLTESKLSENVNPRMTATSFEFGHVTMAEFAKYLGEIGATNLPVADRTGISGFFDIVLKLAEHERITEIPGAGVSTFDALQEQLGLKLEARKIPTEILVVDVAEKIPMEN